MTYDFAVLVTKGIRHEFALKVKISCILLLAFNRKKEREKLHSFSEIAFYSFFFKFSHHYYMEVKDMEGIPTLV